MNFEQAIKRLEEIVSSLEKGETPLEDSMILFSEGTELIRHCSKLLDNAEQKVFLLTKKNGDVIAEEINNVDELS